MGKKRDKRREPPAEKPAVVSAPPKLLPFLEKRAGTIAILAVLLATARIVSTYTVFNHTSDEPAHIACGLEWLDKGRYTWETQHPPLARVATAIGPYLLGDHSESGNRDDFTAMTKEGLRILDEGNRYDLTLALARLGVLPFFWVGCFVVWEWGRRYFGRAVAVLAVITFTFIPTVLAHAGLATTDMALASFIGAAFLAMLMWLESPTPRRAALFGLASGLAILSKFSSLVFFPAAVGLALILYLAVERPSVQRLWRLLRNRLGGIAIAALVVFFVIWAGYRFSYGKVDFASIKLPAPEFYSGIETVQRHNAEGHPSFLLGQRGTLGWWYFFPVVFAFKTPLSILILLGLAVYFGAKRELGFKRSWIPMGFAAGIMLVAMPSRINIGLRHILPVYIGIALLCGMAAVRILERAHIKGAWGIALGVIALWGGVSSLLVHPDYIAYFNELAGGHPENIVVDSDLDWGQDFKRLGARLKEAGAPEVTLFTGYLANFKEFGIPPRIDKTDLIRPSAGWYAASISYWKTARLGLVDRFQQYKLWPDLIPPTERVGKGILVWYFPPGSIPQ